MVDAADRPAADRAVEELPLALEEGGPALVVGHDRDRLVHRLAHPAPFSLSLIGSPPLQAPAFRARRSGAPASVSGRAVGPERPEVPLDVAGAVLAGAVALVGEIADDRRP